MFEKGPKQPKNDENFTFPDLLENRKPWNLAQAVYHVEACLMKVFGPIIL